MEFLSVVYLVSTRMMGLDLSMVSVIADKHLDDDDMMTWLMVT